MRITILSSRGVAGPAGLRVMGLAEALRSAGHQTAVVAPNANAFDPAVVGGAPAVPVTTAMAPSSARSRFGAVRRILPGRSIGADLGRRCAETRPDIVIVHPGSRPAPWLWRQARRSGARAIVSEVTDWHGSRGRLQRYESAVAWRMIRRTPAITCSTWLASELAANGQPTTAIPPLFTSSIRQLAHGAPSLGSGLHLAIAGTAVGLDAPYIRSTLNAAERLSSPDSRVTVHLIGHPERYIKSLPGLVSGALDRAVFHGWLGYRDVVRIVSRVDFVVHQRPADARWVKAGFPSKVVEAWVLGTPVITNLTSDLGDYALDGFNSVVVADGEPAALAAAVARAQGQAGDFNRTQISSWADATLTPSAWASRLDSFLARL